MINIFRIFHVLFASMTLGLMPVGIIMMGRMKKAQGTPAEMATMGNMLALGKTMGMLGALGLLITGGALVGIESYKWFSFSDFPWLAWKQTAFTLILIVSLGLVMPASKKMGGLIAARMASGEMTATDEIRALGAKIGMFSIVMNLLGLTAMTLGVSKGIF